MKVKELIEELQKCNKDADVVVGDFNLVVGVDSGIPSSCVQPVTLETKYSRN
jgi:hypothetical protein